MVFWSRMRPMPSGRPNRVECFISLSRTCSKSCTWKLSRELQCSHLFGKNVEGVSLPPLFNRPWDRDERFLVLTQKNVEGKLEGVGLRHQKAKPLVTFLQRKPRMVPTKISRTGRYKRGHGKPVGAW